MSGINNNDWRSLPRKGRLKRDSSVKIRVPKAYRKAWQEAASKEDASLSDWIFNNLKEIITVEEVSR